MLQPQNYPEEQKNHRGGQNGEREPSQSKFKGASFEINKQMGVKRMEELTRSCDRNISHGRVIFHSNCLKYIILGMNVLTRFPPCI